MYHLLQLITVCDLKQDRLLKYTRHFAGCLVKTFDEKLLLQQRGQNWDRFPGMLATFGGQVDSGETPLEGMARELAEELGACVEVDQLVYLGAFTKEGFDDALIHAYWWHDHSCSITGCYEGEPAYFSTAMEILSVDNITPDVCWIVKECLEKKLIN